MNYNVKLKPLDIILQERKYQESFLAPEMHVLVQIYNGSILDAELILEHHIGEGWYSIRYKGIWDIWSWYKDWLIFL